MEENILSILKKHGEQLELIATTVLSNSNRLDTVEKKLDTLPTSASLDESVQKADTVLKKILAREQEDSMRANALRRVEEKADQNTSDIQKIKPLVGLV